MTQQRTHVTNTYDLDTDIGLFHVEVLEDDLLMYGKLKEMPDGRTVTYVAAAPMDSRASFTGSGLPFADKDQAFFETPNAGRAKVYPDRSFEIRMITPASYYAALGTVLVRPTVFLTFEVKGARRVAHVPLSDPMAFRLLTYPRQRTSCTFYEEDKVILPRTQEAILRASAYPADRRTPCNFWGTKPRL